MGMIPITIEVDGELQEIDARPDETLLNICTSVIPPEKWEECIIHTPSGQVVDPTKPIREVVRETNETRFRVLPRGVEGGIPEFPSFLRNITVKDPRWREREIEEIIRIKMLNNRVINNNPGFGYINPKFISYEGHKVVEGWVRVGEKESISVRIILPMNYPKVPPETEVRGRFIDRYIKSNLHKHLYEYKLKSGKKILALCGDQTYLKKWSGRFGIVHYVEKIIFSWVHARIKEMGGS